MSELHYPHIKSVVCQGYSFSHDNRGGVLTMLESFYLTGWGAFGMMLFMLVPFMAVFFYVVLSKSYGDSSPSKAPQSSFVKMERAWIGLVIVVFVAVNIASIDFMPTTATAKAVASGEKLQKSASRLNPGVSISRKQRSKLANPSAFQARAWIPCMVLRFITPTAKCCLR